MRLWNGEAAGESFFEKEERFSCSSDERLLFSLSLSISLTLTGIT